MSHAEHEISHYREAAEKYKSRLVGGEEHLNQVTGELSKQKDLLAESERKCIELDVEVSALRQQLREEESIQKRLSKSGGPLLSEYHQVVKHLS